MPVGANQVGSRPPGRRWPWAVAALIGTCLAAVSGTGAGTSGLADRRGSEQQETTPTATPEGQAVGLVPIPAPDWWPDVSREVRTLYTWAAANQPVLQYIPCTCGCAGAGHRNNYDCYVKQGARGVEYDPHAYG